MHHHPRMKLVRRLLGSAFRIANTNMGAFGGPTTTPTIIAGNISEIKMLERQLSDDDVVRIKLAAGEEGLVDRDPITRVVSGRKALEGSQAYPAAYGVAVKDVFKKWQRNATTIDSSDDEHDDEVRDPDDLWEDAGLDVVCRWLGVPCDRMLC